MSINRFFGLLLLVALSLLVAFLGTGIVLPWLVNQNSWLTFSAVPVVIIAYAWLMVHLFKKVYKKW